MARVDKDSRTRAMRNRQIRQDALREQLAEQCRVQHILDSVQKLEDLSEEMDQITVQRLRAACDTRLKLLAKYLPDLKSIEVQHEDVTERNELSRTEIAARILSILDGAKREDSTKPH